MKKGKFALLLAVVLAMAGFSQAYASEPEETYRNVKVLETEGSAVLTREETELPVYAQMVVQGGDLMVTGEDGRVDLELDDDKYAVVEESSEVEFELEGKKNNGAIRIYLNAGAIYNEIENPLAEEDSYEIETPDGVMAVRGTKFRVDIEESADGLWRVTTIAVFEGSVYIQVKNTEEEETVITAGEEAIIDKYLGSEEGVEEEARLRKSGGTINFKRLPAYLFERLGSLLDDLQRGTSTENSEDATEATSTETESETESEPETTAELSTADFTVDDSDQTYTGSAIEPSVSSATLGAEDYEVAYSDNISVGTATITITGKGSYTGTLTYNFAITKQSVEIPVADTTDYTYNGSSQTYNLATSTLYTIDGQIQSAVGTYQVTVTLNDTANYQWSDATVEAKTYTFTIGKGQVEIPMIAPATYDGTEQKADISNTEFYEVTKNEAGTNADSYEVVLTIKDSYSSNYVWSGTENNGSITLTFEIKQRAVSLTWSTLDAADLEYSDTRKTLSVTAENILADDIGTVSVTCALTAGCDNLNVGTFTYTAALASGSNTNYCLPDDPKSPEYTITPKTIPEGFFKVDTSDKEWDGGEITTTYQTTDTVTTYTVEYTNNSGVGVATITFRGTGNYTGTYSFHFNIVDSVSSSVGNLALTADDGTDEAEGSAAAVTMDMETVEESAAGAIEEEEAAEENAAGAAEEEEAAEESVAGAAEEEEAAEGNVAGATEEEDAAEGNTAGATGKEKSAEGSAAAVTPEDGGAADKAPEPEVGEDAREAAASEGGTRAEAASEPTAEEGADGMKTAAAGLLFVPVAIGELLCFAGRRKNKGKKNLE